jgi:hypothetical protein
MWEKERGKEREAVNGCNFATLPIPPPSNWLTFVRHVCTHNFKNHWEKTYWGFARARPCSSVETCLMRRGMPNETLRGDNLPVKHPRPPPPSCLHLLHPQHQGPAIGTAKLRGQIMKMATRKFGPGSVGTEGWTKSQPRNCLDCQIRSNHCYNKKAKICNHQVPSAWQKEIPFVYDYFGN